MSTKDEELEKAIRESVLENSSKTVPLPSDVHLHVNCYAKHQQKVDALSEHEEKQMQWYKADRSLYSSEIEAMTHFFPDAVCGFMPDSGRMYWVIVLQNCESQQHREWRLMLVYDNNHPQNQKYGGLSVKVIPVKPNFEEIKQMIRGWSQEEQLYAMSRHRVRRDVVCGQILNIGNIKYEENKILSAAGVALRVQNWINLFENSLVNEKYRKIFCNGEKIAWDPESYQHFISEVDKMERKEE